MPVELTSSPNVTFKNLVDNTKNLLYANQRVEMNKLLIDCPIGTSTNVTTSFPLEGIGRGSMIEIADELIYVWTTNVAGVSMTNIQRGMNGTTEANHLAGDLITVNPKFPISQIKKAIVDEIRSWGPQLYQEISAAVALSADIRGYQLDVNNFGVFYRIIDVRHSNVVSSSAETNPLSWPRVKNWKLIHTSSNAISDFPSGNAIVIPDTYSTPPTLLVTVAAPFVTNTAMTDTTDMVTGVGLGESMLDIAPIGAAWRMMMTREVRRTNIDAGADPATLRDVPPDYTARTAASLKKIRDDRIAEEAGNLIAATPQAGWG